MKEAAATGQLLERSEELARIESALAEARSGRGTFVVVEGPAGIGKTALLAAARAAAAEGGMRVLRSRGTELERDFAFGVVRQLFEPPLVEASERRARRSPARRCRRRGRPARASGRTPRRRSALVGRRSLVRDPPRPLLAVREPGRRRAALRGRRRRALGGRRVPPLPGLPAHAARRAGRRARRGDPPSRGGHRCRAACDRDDRSVRRCDPALSADESRRCRAPGGATRWGSGSRLRRHLPARDARDAVPPA